VWLQGDDLEWATRSLKGFSWFDSTLMSQCWTCFGIARRTGDYLCFDLCVVLSFLLCLLLGLLLGLVLGWCLRKRLLLQQ